MMTTDEGARLGMAEGRRTIRVYTISGGFTVAVVVGSSKRKNPVWR